MAEMQTYATHRRWIPYFHFFALPILGLNVLAQLYVLIRHFSGWAIWNVLVASALAALVVATRNMATTAQDRIIRLEETLRLQRCLPADMRGRIGELTTGQLIGLRFCSDEEVTELTRAVLGGELRGREDIKKRIKTWRPDTLRV
ncbi:MAG TPA: DUF6526 family protein [Thermoanaerobaculia bacterium]|nr:DUF6526 family protein [Thermoanaerobaculia bacterium]